MSPVRASVGKLRIPSGRARNLVPAVASRPRSSLSTESERAFRPPAPARQPGLSDLRRASPPRPEGPAGKWRWQSAVLPEGPGSSETLRPLRPRPGAAQCPEEDRLLGYALWGRPLRIRLVLWGSTHTSPRPAFGLGSISTGILQGQLLSGVFRAGELLATSAESSALPDCLLSALPPSFLFVACDSSCKRHIWVSCVQWALTSNRCSKMLVHCYE